MGRLGWLLVVVVLGGASATIWQVMTPEPEGHVMTTPDMSRVDDGGAIVEVTVPDTLSDDAMIGMRAFEANCAACHGSNAVGTKGKAPPLVHKIYEPNHHSDMAFLMAVQNGVRAHHWPFGNMPPIEGLTKGDVRYIAQYVRELQRANGIE